MTMAVTRLDDFALLHFSGTDAAEFLHGQLTCDVKALRPGMSSYGGYCTPKGRLLATFLLWPEHDGYTLLLPAAIAEAVRKRLSMYILRAKVKAELQSPARVAAGLSRPDAGGLLDKLGLAVPEAVHRVSCAEAGCAISLPGDRVLAVAAADRVNAGPDGGSWALADIAAGIPFILPATQEEFVPQMVNLDLIGALSYSKGCYPGQEIVARTHYLGRLKQRMYRALVAAPAAPSDKLYCSELGDQSAGMVVSASAAGDGRHALLAVLQTANAATATYHLGSPGGAPLTLSSLPYAIN